MSLLLRPLTFLTVEVTEPELQSSEAEREQTDINTKRLAPSLVFVSIVCVVTGFFT